MPKSALRQQSRPSPPLTSNLSPQLKLKKTKIQLIESKDEHIFKKLEKVNFGETSLMII